MQDVCLRRDLLDKLDALCSGLETRDQVAQWAMSIIDNDNINVTDKMVWEILLGLGAADLPSTDRDYLYSLEDFNAWKDELF